MRNAVLGQPVLSVDRPIVLVNFRPNESATPVTVTITNTGTGILSWRVSTNKPWLKTSLQAGVAIGPDLPCQSTSPCQRTATLQITVDPSQLLGSDAGVVHIQGLGPEQHSRRTSPSSSARTWRSASRA